MSVTPTVSNGTSGLNTAVNALQMGLSWTNMQQSAVTVTYTYDLTDWSYGIEHWYGGMSNAQTLNAAQKAAAEASFQMWENVANINFIQQNNGDGTDIVLRQADIHNSGVAGWALPFTYQGSNQLAKVDIVYDAGYNSNPTPGSHPYQVIMHEIGHALGLDDVSVKAGAGSFYDNWDGTIMSYNAGAHATFGSMAITPMIYDIAAAQALYGANTSYNSGNTTYSVNGSGASLTIWDGGGVDTLSAAGYGASTVLDLREGIYNVSQIGATNVWIAFNANIEHATAGHGHDRIFGNHLNNTLTGGGGNDTLDGGAGNDTLAGGVGHDTYVFNSGYGADVISDADGQGAVYVNGAHLAGTAQSVGSHYTMQVGGQNYTLHMNGGDLVLVSGTDQLVFDNFQNGQFGIQLNGAVTQSGGLPDVSGAADVTAPVEGAVMGSASHDLIRGTAQSEAIYGMEGNDKLYGRSGDDHILGEIGNDSLYGNRGNDVIDGGVGNDRIHGGKDSDFVSGGLGNDFVFGEVGNDVVNGNDGSDTMQGNQGDDTMNGGAGNDLIRGGKDNDIIDGGAGNDTLRGDKGDDTLTGGTGADVFVFTGGGQDVITDFQDGVDVIQLRGNLNNIVNNISYDAGGATIHLNNGHTITVENTFGLGLDDFISL